MDSFSICFEVPYSQFGLVFSVNDSSQSRASFPSLDVERHRIKGLRPWSESKSFYFRGVLARTVLQNCVVKGVF